MSYEPTVRIDVERPDAPNGNGRTDGDTATWSFEAIRRVFVRAIPRRSDDKSDERVFANSGEARTAGQRPKFDYSKVRPVAGRPPSFGRRAFTPLYQWEGVVENLHGEGFRARLVPFEDGRAEPARVEYADFDYSDLEDESDRELIAPGAVFYWTVGRAQTAWGQHMKSSLLRFRRLPPVTPYREREASREADALLRDLGVD